MIKFNLPQIEAKWRMFYLNNAFKYAKIEPTIKELYILPQFPYPSGQLHMGHVRVYTISDILNRFNRLKGAKVLHPIGWDAFGLPADNAARLHSICPSEWTKDNISSMTQQLQSLSIDFDYNATINTSFPSFYKWTQTIFCKLFNAGLVYQREARVNWDPIDETVLADEQVIDGKSWRSGASVEDRFLVQWFVKITDFKEDLLYSLNNDLPHYPSHIKEMQRNWIMNGSCPDRPFRDWLISRQREWGTPIPIIHCLSCGPQAVPLKDLPVPLLPKDGIEREEFINNVKCPCCGANAKRETDTMDTFMDSSFYYIMFSNHQTNKDGKEDPLSLPHRPVDIYIGGKEHAILHLLYARFIYKFLYNRKAEPFKKLICQGLVEGMTFRRKEDNSLISSSEAKEDSIMNWEKMSKSKHNGVNPLKYVDGFGADALRLALIFKSPPDQNIRWEDQCIIGSQRFLRRLLSIAERIGSLFIRNNDDSEIGEHHHHYQFYHSKELFSLLKEFDHHYEGDIKKLKLNLSIARIMKFTNQFESLVVKNNIKPSCQRLAFTHLATTLHPIAPLISGEIILLLNRFSYKSGIGPMKMEDVVFEKPKLIFKNN